MCVFTTMQNLFLSFLPEPSLQAHYQKSFLIIEKYSFKIFDNKKVPHVFRINRVLLRDFVTQPRFSQALARDKLSPGFEHIRMIDTLRKDFLPDGKTS